ncbi:MAG: hypothetical protein EZS28_048377 [Streblomastix strix]|uniref:RRM domain-containing protein n=1 Tax=Streblomastix strix TaxID=222440 RepID=A0A5J4TCE3_9EUKA|nr:MAG: hypothetical protein EZS28_048377 [Streblomastix strix]
MEDVDLAILLTGTKIEGLHISVQRVGVDGLAIESAQIKAQQSGSTQQGASGGQGVGQKLEGKVIGPGNELISAAAQQKFNQQLVQAARSGARIIVSNIHPITEEAEIRKLFSQFGEIQSLKMTEVQSEDIEDDKEEKKKKKEKEDKQKEKKQKQKEKQKKKEKKWKDDEDEEEDKSSDDKTNGDADALEEFINTKVTKSAIIEYPTMMEAAEAVNVMNGAVILIPIIVTLDQIQYNKD